MEAAAGQLLEVHLGTLARYRLGITDPDRLGLTKPLNESTTASKDPIDTAQAAGDQAGLLEVGVQAADAETELAVAAAHDINNVGRERARRALRASRATI
ncbi:MAG TPA: hypothetical protein VJL07_04875 [Dehalococcoidia bacterium]|nr:hypothetical protein [Dehalococcoidia bacterium]